MGERWERMGEEMEEVRVTVGKGSEGRGKERRDTFIYSEIGDSELRDS